MARTRTIAAGFRPSTQITGNIISIRKFMASRNFVDGFESVRRGKPFDYDRPVGAAWAYERGRQLATIYSGALKEGRRVRDAAIAAYTDARRAGVII